MGDTNDIINYKFRKTWRKVMEHQLTSSFYLNQRPIILSAITHDLQTNWGSLPKYMVKFVSY